MDNIIYSVWLSEIIGVESKNYTKLLDRFGSVADIYAGEDFGGLKLSESALRKLADKDISDALRIIDECRNRGITIIDRENPLYPKRLLAISTPPFLLYGKGMLRVLDDEVCIAVVGTRNMSAAGKLAALNMGYGLSVGGAAVISGLAQGIDSTAHIGCLKAGGYTVAVLGCGHAEAIRGDNSQLFATILKKGAIISEYPPSVRATRYTFPQRNRIISGMSQATVVVEANESSGALITARYAAKQGRPVYAVANNDGVLDYSGGITLLEDGARLVRGADEVLERFELMYPHKINKEEAALALNRFRYSDKEEIAPTVAAAKPQRTSGKNAGTTALIEKPVKSTDKAQKQLPVEFDESGLGSFEREVCRRIYEFGAATPDELCAMLSTDITKINMTLTSLELCGFIEAAAGGSFLPRQQ